MRSFVDEKLHMLAKVRVMSEKNEGMESTDNNLNSKEIYIGTQRAHCTKNYRTIQNVLTYLYSKRSMLVIHFSMRAFRISRVACSD